MLHLLRARVTLRHAGSFRHGLSLQASSRLPLECKCTSEREFTSVYTLCNTCLGCDVGLPGGCLHSVNIFLEHAANLKTERPPAELHNLPMLVCRSACRKEVAPDI